MIFPRPTVKVGKCVAVISNRNTIKQNRGAPIVNRRPYLSYKGKSWRASRLSYYLNVKKIPITVKLSSNKLVLHTCDNEWCINAKHLYLGSQKDNIRDILERHPTIRLQRSNYMKGNTNTLGLKATSITRKKLSDAKIGNKNASGLVHTEKAKKKMSEAHMGNSYCLGYKHTKEARENMRISQLNRQARERAAL